MNYEDILRRNKKMSKITLKKFWVRDKKLAIHCKTEEQAIKLLGAFAEMDKFWRDGTPYTEDAFWNHFKDQTCYSNYGGHADVSYYNKSNIKVYEFEDVIFGEGNENER